MQCSGTVQMLIDMELLAHADYLVASDRCKRSKLLQYMRYILYGASHSVQCLYVPPMTGWGVLEPLCLGGSPLGHAVFSPFPRKAAREPSSAAAPRAVRSPSNAAPT